MNKEEFLKAIENIPKTDSINPISAYNSINVEDLANAVDRFKKVPTYDELLKENQKYKEVIYNVSNQIKMYGRYNGEKCTRGFSMMIADFNKLLDILKEVE